MLAYQKILASFIIYFELLAFLSGIIHWKKVSKSKWKFFVIYLGLIFFLESFSLWGLQYFSNTRQYYYGFIVIPFEFIFLFWFYGNALVKYKWLIILFTFLYLIAFIPEVLFFKGKSWYFYSFSYTIANLFLSILAILEFQNQLKSNKILQFKNNMMFYINIGVILFYIGTLPFFGLYGLIVKDIELWRMYYTSFIFLNYLMYLFFAAAFIWGNPNT